MLVELRSALLHLNDLAYLEKHPLASRLTFIAQAPELARGQLLRRALRLAIEALDPGADVPASAPEARPFQILRRHYISRQTIEEIARDLDVAERHAYRELRRATEALVQILCDGELRTDFEFLTERAPARIARVHEEVERLLSVDKRELDLVQLATLAVHSVQPLADKRGIAIRLLADDPCLYVAVNRTMLRQAIINLLSHIAGVHQSTCLSVRVGRAGDNALIECIYLPEAPKEPPVPEEPYAVAIQLLSSLGLQWTRDDLEDGAARITVYVPLVQEHTVLIIDDNPGVTSLFRRYLWHTPYSVYTTSNAQDALETVESLLPDVVILDVMMPGLDGWEILERLRASEKGHQARVVVCSIINDPQLAGALGADAFLHKPVDRARLLQVLDQVISSPST